MPFIRFSVSKRCALLTTSISLDGEIISPYSCCVKKGLIYIIITNFFSRQFSSYTKCTKLNTCTLCDVCLVSLNKYTFLYYARYYAY